MNKQIIIIILITQKHEGKSWRYESSLCTGEENDHFPTANDN